MKRGSEKIVSIGDWGAAGMTSYFFSFFRGLALATFKESQHPMPNQTPNLPTCPALITHHKCMLDAPILIDSTAKRITG
jgi:hypothetical protein